MNDLFHDPATIRNAGFADFWALIPQGAKSGKAVAQKAWAKLSPKARQDAKTNAASYYDWWRRSNPQASWLHPASYLNQRRWEDEAFSPPLVNETTKDRAAFWADHIKSGKPISRFSVTPTLCDEMLGRGLVTREQLRERGLG